MYKPEVSNTLTLPDRPKTLSTDSRLEMLQRAMEDTTRRLIRIETRMCKLMLSSGLSHEGDRKTY